VARRVNGILGPSVHKPPVPVGASGKATAVKNFIRALTGGASKQLAGLQSFLKILARLAARSRGARSRKRKRKPKSPPRRGRSPRARGKAAPKAKPRFRGAPLTAPAPPQPPVAAPVGPGAPAPPPEDKAYPASFDFYEQNPSCKKQPRLQGMCGSCTVFATTSALADRHCKLTGGAFRSQLSTGQVIGCLAKEGAPITERDLCTAGFSPLDVASVMKSQGLFAEDCFASQDAEYKCALLKDLGPFFKEVPPSMLTIADDLPCYKTFVASGAFPTLTPRPKADRCFQSCPSSGARVFAKDAFMLTGPVDAAASPGDQQAQQESNERAIMEEILSAGPVVAIISETPEALYAYKSGVFSYTKPAAPSAPPTPGAPAAPSVLDLFSSTAHAVKIFGWGVEGTQRYWLIENSWSAKWGSGGYFKLQRGTNMLGVESAVFSVLPTTATSGSSWDESTVVLKVAMSALRELDRVIKPKAWTQELTQISDLASRLRSLVAAGSPDADKIAAADAVVDVVKPLFMVNMPDKRFMFLLQFLIMGAAELEDESVLKLASVTPHIQSLKEISAAAPGAELSDAQVAALTAFLAETRVASYFIAREHGVAYSKSRDAFKRLFMVSSPPAAATPTSLRELMKSGRGAGLRKYIAYLLQQ